MHDIGGDIADSNIASQTPDMAAHIDTLEDQWLEATRGMTREAAVGYCAKQSQKTPSCDLGHFIAWVLDDANPILKLWAAAFTFGLEITQGASQMQVARKLHVTRAALSKRVTQMSKLYGIISRNMKSLSARDSYQREKKTNHHRYQEEIESAQHEYHEELLN